jgi:hypothetical protein
MGEAVEQAARPLAARPEKMTVRRSMGVLRIGGLS